MGRRRDRILSCLFLTLTLAACRINPTGQTNTVEVNTPAIAERPTLPPPALTQAAGPATAIPPTVAAPTQPPPTVTITIVVEPTVTPALPTLTPEPSPTPAPTEPPPTPTPAPTATAEALYPPWLTYLNRFRTMGNLAPLSERAALTLGSELHSQYMVVNDAAISHKQDPANPLYSTSGDQAARNGNVFATSMLEADYIWGINFWASAPFHLVPMLAPQLERVGYGNFNEQGGNVSMAAVLDVRSERDAGNGTATYPLLFPQDGSTTWIGRHNLFEWPDPLTSCSGYSRPSGPPIVIQLGTGDLVPEIGGHALHMGDTPVETCIFDETSYYNPDPWAQKAGRLILDNQDAIVIMPRQPLIANQTYTVQVEANGQRYTWRFNTVASANEAP